MNNQLATLKRNVFAFILTLLMIGAGVQQAHAQPPFNSCDAITPIDTFDFINFPSSTFNSADITRRGDCCPGKIGEDEDCIHFVLLLGPTTAAVQMGIISGAGALGSFNASIDCDTLQQAVLPVCIDNNSGVGGTFHLTFCKPGENTNAFSITAVPRPTFPNDTVAFGCSDTMRVLGMTGVTWTSISPGSSGQYNSLLSCTNCLQPVFTPTATTPALVRYRVCGTVTAGNCLGITTFCDTVDVTVTPAWSSVADVTICAPTTTASLGAAPASAVWSFVSGPATPTINGSTGAITNLTADGTYNFVLRRTNGGGICTDTAAVIRAAKPNAGIDQSICAPQTTASLGTAVGGTWSFLSGAAAASVHPTTGAVTGMTAVGNYNFQLGSGTCSDTVVITIKAQPAQPTCGNNGPLCVGATLNLTASSVTGGVTYQWSNSPAGFNSTTQNPSIPNIATGNAGIYKVVALLNGCPSDTCFTTLVVNTIPAAPGTSSNTPVCEGDTLKLFATGAGGATYAWTGPSFASASQNPFRFPATLSMDDSPYCVTQTVSGCTSSQSCFSVVINAKPVISTAIGSNPTTCGGSNGTITIGGLTAGVNYDIDYKKNGVDQLTVTQVASGGGTVVISGLTAGSYTDFVVSVVSSGCTSNAFAGPVVLSDPSTPAAPGASSNTPVCEGDTLKLFATGTGTFSWTGCGGFNSSNQNPVRPNATLAMGCQYCVTQTVSGCTSAPACTTPVINPKPVIGSAVGTNPTTCGGTNGFITLSGLANSTLYQVSYDRNGTGFGPLPISSNGSGQVVIPNLNAGTYSDFVVEVNSTGCTSVVFPGPVVLSDPNTPSAPGVSSNTPVCEGDTLKLFATGQGGASYTWTGCNGFSSGNQNPVRPNATLAMGCQYCVTQTVAGCTSAPACTTPVINAKPVIGSVTSSNPTTCGGSDGCIFLNGLSPNTSYSVDYQRNNADQGPVTLSTNGSGQISICGLGTGTYDDFFVTLLGCESPGFGGSVILSNPANPAPPSVGGDNSVCVGDSICLTATGAVGATYSWSGPLSYSSSTEDPCRPNATTGMTGNYCVTQTVNNCTSAPACIFVTVNPNPVAHAGATQSICMGTCATLGAVPTATGGTPQYSFSWSSGDNVARPIVCPTTNTVYTLTVTDANGCTASDNTLVNVNANPSADAGPDKNLVACTLSSVNIGGGPTATGGQVPYTYEWTPGGGLSSTTTSNPLVSNIGSTTCYTVVVTDDNGCTASDEVCVLVTSGTYNAVILPNTSLSWCSETLGNVTLTALAFDGTPPYNYDWTGQFLDIDTGTQVTANPSICGTYIYGLVVTDQTGCQVSDTIVVTVHCTPVADAGPADSVCSGFPVVLGGAPTGSGGFPPYTYLWNLGASPVANPVVNPTSSATYLVTVTDAHGCTATDSKSVIVRPNPDADAGPDVVLPTCSPTGVMIGGSPAGSGGTPPYSFTWSPLPGLSSGFVANPSVGSIGTDRFYTLTVTDVHGCIDTDQVFVDVVINTPVVSISPAIVGWCANSGTSAVLQANVSGGSPTFDYSWNGSFIVGPTNTQVITVNPQAANTYNYTVTVTDFFNCTATATRAVIVTPNPIANAGSPSTICSGECDTLGAAPTASGGTPPYTYSWSHGPTDANPEVCPTSTTIYRVTVTDANGCTATAITAVTVRTNPVADAGSDQTITSCAPRGVAIGSAPTASGGCGAPFTYSWSPAATGANPVVLPGSTTTYCVTITDACGCTASDCVVVNVVDNTPSVSISATATEWCAGSGGTAELTAVVSGGTGAITFEWSGTPPPDPNPSNGQVVTVNPGTAGTYTYTVTVTDASGCTATASRTITVNPNPTADAGANDTICNGECVTIGGVQTASGGTPSYSYSWSHGDNGANPNVCPLTSTTYVVTVTDSESCSATSATTVIVYPNPVADAGPDKTLVSCTGNDVTIGGSPTGFGGSGSFTYLWSSSPPGPPTPSVANPVVSPTVTTTYCVTVTDAASGCTATDCVTITVIPSSLQAYAATSVSYCAGSVPPVNVGGTPTASGGTAPYTFQWTGSPISANNVPNPSAQPTATTTYCVTVTDANGCTASACMTITVNPLPDADAGNDTSLCFGFSAVIGGDPTGSGGTGTLTYVWTPGTGLNSSGIANPTATPGSSETYCVTVTDANGCSASDCATVIVNPSPVADAGEDFIITTCAGDSVLLGGSPTGSGGTPPLTCSWTTPLGGSLNNPNLCNPYFYGTVPGIYYDTLIVTDVNGCSDMDVVRIIVRPSSLQVDAGNDDTVCAGSVGNITLGGFDVVLGGEAPYTFAWSAPGFSSSAPHPVVSPGATTTYCLTVTDINGCTAVDCVTIVVNPGVVADAGNDTTVCAGVSVQIGGGPTASGGTPNYTYDWGGAFGLSSNTLANPFATAFITTSYCVTVTDSKGCTASDCITVTVRENPVADAGPDEIMPACNNSCVQIGGSPTASGGGGLYTFRWSPPQGPQPLSDSSVSNPFVCNLGSDATYCVTVTDQFGCSASACTFIDVTNPTLTACAGNDVTFCQGSTICVTLGCQPISGNGGTLPYTFDWSSVPASPIQDISNPVVCPTVTTTYFLVVTDANGCIATDQVTVTINPRPIMTPLRDIIICEGECTQLGENPTASGGTGPITYVWSSGGGTGPNPVVCPLTTTVYCVTATDSLGCSASACQTVTVNPKPEADAGPDQTIFDCLGASANLGGSPTGSGGSNNFTYQWIPCLAQPVPMSSCTQSNPVVTGLTSTTTFTVIVTDNVTGCIDSDQVVITVIPSDLEANAGRDTVYCQNNASCIIIGGVTSFVPLSASGGTPPYTYAWGPGGVQPVANPCVSPTVTTTYCVTVVDANGCSAIDCMTITLSPLITANAGADTLICTGTCLTLGGIPVGTGGIPPYTYLWSSGTFPPDVEHPTACPTSNTAYGVIVTDSRGCSDADAINVFLRSAPIANAGPNAIIVACDGDSVILGGSPTGTGTQGPYTYQWGPPIPVPIDSPNPVVRNLGAGTDFCVTVTDVFGCTATDCAFVSVVPNTLFVRLDSITPLCTANLTCVTLGGSPTVTGGIVPYQYQWFGGTVVPPNGANPQACPTSTTTYTVVVTDDHNCSAAGSQTVRINTSPVASFTGLNSQYCVNAQNAQLTGSPPGGVFSGAGITGNFFSPSLAGVGGPFTITYIVCVGGCCDTVEQTVTVNPIPAVSVTGYQPSYCSYEDCDTLIGTPAGGVFNPALPGNVFCPATATPGTNVITYTYTDPQTGCTNSTTFTIIVRPEPTLDITVSSDTVCQGQSVTMTPNYSIDVTNIQYAVLGGNTFASGLNPITFIPTGVDYCVVATAVSTNGCVNRDTICIHVNQPPVAANDSVATCEDSCIAIAVLDNDTDPENDVLIVSCDTSSNGSTIVQNGVITYCPVPDFNGLDTVTYCVCNVQCPAQCDTGFIFISVCPINDTPVAPDVSANTCRDSAVVITMNNSDVDAGDILTATDIGCAPLNGTITNFSLTGFTYTPSAGFVGTQTICIQVCDTSNACDTATITITVDPCNHPPVAVDDAAQADLCDYDTLNISVLDNDTDPDNGDVLSVDTVFQPTGSGGGTVTLNGNVVTYHPGTAGSVTIRYVVCDNGSPVLCDEGAITINVIDCIMELDVVSDTICMSTQSRTCLATDVQSTYPWTITSICQPQNGTAVVSSDPTCFNYTPTQGFVGNDTFCVTVCDEFGHCDDTTVVMTILDCLIQAIDEPCDLTETPMNTSITIDVLNNDIIPAGEDTVVTIECTVENGSALVNNDNTIIVTPDVDFEGEITFCYRVCVISGSIAVCDTASVCVTVIDTNCYIPNAFSPNDDGVNDNFKIPCNDNFPDATLRIFDRWGVEVWYSKGHYLDDFKGENMQGTELPDGTYYLIYSYNDGSGKQEAKFVVIHR